MSRCGICNNTAVGKKYPSLSCGGSCKKLYHLSCIGGPADLPQYMKDVPGLQWKCDVCRHLNDSFFDDGKLQDIFQERVDNFLDGFNSMLDELKLQFVEIARNKVSQITLPSTSSSINKPPSESSSSSKINKPLYASVVRSSSQPAIIIKPKNAQPNQQTKSDILQNFNPIKSDTNFNKIKHIKDGGLIISCSSTEQTSKFKKQAEQKLSTNYEIREIKPIHPRIRLVGISGELDPETLREYILKQNCELFSDDSECKIIKTWSTKKNNNLFQATLQLDITSYNKVMNNGYLIVGLDVCRVYDAVNILRCFNCNAYNHSRINCNKDVTCPRCAASHSLDKCNADKLKCINCVSLNASKNLNLSTEHAAWDHNECSVYLNAVAKLKTDLGHQ